MSASLHIEGVARRGAFTLEVAFDAGPGVTVIAGPSASGKSLTLRLIAGLSPLDRGALRYGQTRWCEAPGYCLDPALRGVGYSPQEAALWSHRRVLDGLTLVAPRARALEALSRVGAEGLATRWPGTLSGGERQRVALARALSVSPRVLLLDEPWSALPRDVRAVLFDMVQRWSRDTGAVVLLVTHDADAAVSQAERVIEARPGRVVAPRSDAG
ncbi:MAG: ATP-binding cassette domain-containing protein [Myxococcales bacterium]|nr:ATP-binding cassette domain-containing protein [Myxococcales bacterium]